MNRSDTAQSRPPVSMGGCGTSQYVGFILVLTGFLLQSPMLPALAIYPVLVVMYDRLGRNEETATIAEFGDAYRGYMARTGGFFPKWRARSAD